jgi:hypothetical protein
MINQYKTRDMKKLHIILIVFLFTITSATFAQFKYGPRIALGSSSLGGGSTSFGIQAGLFINAELRDRVGLQVEVLYSIKNGVDKYTHTNEVSGAKSEWKTKYSFTYIDIPFYFYFPLSKHITFLAGPQFCTINKATQATEGSGVPASETNKQSVSGTDAKMGIAAGLDFDLSSPIRFGLRFTTNGGEEAFKGKSTFIGATMAYYMNW